MSQKYANIPIIIRFKKNLFNGEDEYSPEVWAYFHKINLVSWVIFAVCKVTNVKKDYCCH